MHSLRHKPLKSRLKHQSVLQIFVIMCKLRLTATTIIHWFKPLHFVSSKSYWWYLKRSRCCNWVHIDNFNDESAEISFRLREKKVYGSVGLVPVAFSFGGCWWTSAIVTTVFNSISSLWDSVSLSLLMSMTGGGLVEGAAAITGVDGLTRGFDFFTTTGLLMSMTTSGESFESAAGIKGVGLITRGFNFLTGIFGLTGGFDFVAGTGWLVLSGSEGGDSIAGRVAFTMGWVLSCSIIHWRLKWACIFSRRNCRNPTIQPQMRNKKGTKSCFNLIGEILCSIWTPLSPYLSKHNGFIASRWTVNPWAIFQSDLQFH